MAYPQIDQPWEYGGRSGRFDDLNVEKTMTGRVCSNRVLTHMRHGPAISIEFPFQ